MAFNKFGKLNAASAFLTHRPAGFKNLPSVMWRTNSLLGIGEFLDIEKI
jgi:hypothetical protein